MERRKFKILYPEDHHEVEKRGKPYKPGWGEMVVMDGSGVFFLYTNGVEYYSVSKLSDVLPKYDVVWKEK